MYTTQGPFDSLKQTGIKFSFVFYLGFFYHFLARFYYFHVCFFVNCVISCKRLRNGRGPAAAPMGHERRRWGRLCQEQVSEPLAVASTSSRGRHELATESATGDDGDIRPGPRPGTEVWEMVPFPNAGQVLHVFAVERTRSRLAWQAVQIVRLDTD